jgi:hypothetical protein
LIDSVKNRVISDGLLNKQISFKEESKKSDTLVMLFENLVIADPSSLEKIMEIIKTQYYLIII